MWLLLAIGFVLGAVLGSFAEVVAERLLESQTILGRSCCPRCKHTLGWYDLFPIFSFVFLKGKCRYCHQPISLPHFLVEIGLGLAMAVTFYVVVPNPEILFSLTWECYLTIFSLILNTIIVTVLTVVFITDLKKGLILDKVIISASALVGIYLLLTSIFKSWLLYEALSHISIGKYLFPPYSSYFTDQLQRLWLPLLWSLLTGMGLSVFFILLIIITRGKGMGWGDVKLVFFLGLAVGFPNAVLGVFLGFLLGAVFSLTFIAIGKKKFGQTIPFGPFLATGAFIALLWGSQIINWYFSSFKLGY